LPLGAYTTACRGSSLIVALEENKDIFDAILKPMRKSTQAMVVIQLLPIVVVSKDPNDKPVQPWKFGQKENSINKLAW